MRDSNSPQLPAFPKLTSKTHVVGPCKIRLFKIPHSRNCTNENLARGNNSNLSPIYHSPFSCDDQTFWEAFACFVILRFHSRSMQIQVRCASHTLFCRFHVLFMVIVFDIISRIFRLNPCQNDSLKQQNGVNNTETARIVPSV